MKVDSPEEKLIEIRATLKSLLGNWPTSDKAGPGYYFPDPTNSVKSQLRKIVEDLEANEKD